MPIRLIQLVVDLCLFRRGPQDLPHNPPLALAGVVALMGLELFAPSTQSGPGDYLPLAVYGVLFVLIVWAALRLRKVDARFWQTLLGLAGSALLFSLLMLPIRMTIGPIDPATYLPVAPMSPLIVLLLLANLVLALWRLVVQGHIWRHALETSLPVGILTALAVEIVSLVTLVSLFRAASV
jgi:hypothetical protein